MALAGANLEGEERLLDREIGADDQEGLALVEILRGGELTGCAAERVDERDDVARAVVIDVVGAEALARELLQIEILFVRGVVRADDAELADREL